MGITIDGSVAAAGTGSIETGVMTSVNAGNVIVVAVATNGGVASAVTATGATFTKLAQTVGPGFNVWLAYASGVFSSAISVTNPGAFISVQACAVSGCPSTGYLDTDASNPNVGLTDPRTISTTASDTIIFGAFRQGGQSSPTQGTGFTKVFGVNFGLLEYKIVSSPQTSLSVTEGTPGDANGGIAFALVAAPSGISGGVLGALQEMGVI